MRVAAQVAHRSQAGAVSAKARRRRRRATQSCILRLIDGKGRIRFVAVSADNDAVHVRRIARRVSKLDAVHPRVQTNWNRGREREVRASAAQIQRNIRPIVDIDDERAGAGRH